MLATSPQNPRDRNGAYAMAHADLAEIADDIAFTPLELIEETLGLCVSRVEEMVGLGLIERAEAADAIWNACVDAGLVKARGVDAVQRLLADIIRHWQDTTAPNELPSADEDEDDKASRVRAWPIMQSAAMHGIVGKIARLATARSEADPVAVMLTTLVYAAAEFGRNQHIRIGDDLHHSRHFGAIVGSSARARKGTSFAPVGRLFKAAEQIRSGGSPLPFPPGGRLKVSRGPLSSGEGLINAIRDKSDDNEDDAGVTDKRLLVVEGELGAAFRAFQRTGNNLSMILRTLFDGETVEPLTKNNRLRTTDPHVCLLGHITRHELKALLPANEVWNGLGNRFIWVCARRPRTVAFPQPMPDDEVNETATELARVVALAHERESVELTMSNSAIEHWARVYPELTADHPGILGAVTSRSEAHARRLALTYAQLDGAERIEIVHLEAALAVCRYAFDSAAYLFGGSELDPDSQKLLKALADGPKTQTEINGLFCRHRSKDELSRLLTDLQEQGRITLTKEPTGGAPRNIWSRAS